MILKDIVKKTIENQYFRKVLLTGKNSQIVVMSLKKDEEIGMEVHMNIDQILVIVGGLANTVIDNKENEAKEGDVIFVPAGSNHNIINIGKEELKIYTIYSPPEHPDRTIHRTREEAMKAEEDNQHA